MNIFHLIAALVVLCSGASCTLPAALFAKILPHRVEKYRQYIANFQPSKNKTLWSLIHRSRALHHRIQEYVAVHTTSINRNLMERACEDLFITMNAYRYLHSLLGDKCQYSMTVSGLPQDWMLKYIYKFLTVVQAEIPQESEEVTVWISFARSCDSKDWMSENQEVISEFVNLMGHKAMFRNRWAHYFGVSLAPSKHVKMNGDEEKSGKFCIIEDAEESSRKVLFCCNAMEFSFSGLSTYTKSLEWQAIRDELENNGVNVPM